MARLIPAALLGVLLVGRVSAQCGYPVPWYPGPVYVPGYGLSPAVWGAPAPRPLPPAPFLPKAGAGVKEESLPVPRTTPVEPKPVEPKPEGPKPDDPKPKEKDPRLPKLKLPLPGDPDVPLSKSTDPPAGTAKVVDQFFVPADRKRSEPSAEVRVGFFNHSDREIVLEVNGELVRLPSEQYVTLRVSRTFTWSEKGHKGTDVVVPPDAEGIEIVFRR